MIGVFGVIFVLVIVGFFAWKDIKKQSISRKKQAAEQKSKAKPLF